MSITQGHRFFLHVTIPDQLPRKVEVIDHISAGLDPRCDLVLVDKKIRNRHFLFEKKGPVLSVKVLVADSPSFLNNQPMVKDRAYIIDQGDLIEAGKITITLTSMFGDVVEVPEKSRSVQFSSMDELAPEKELDLKEIPVVAQKSKAKKIGRTKKQKSILIHIKALAIILDFFISYVVMMVTGLFVFLPIPLFAVFWLLRVLFGLLFGRTLGEMLLGLTRSHYSQQTRLAPALFISLLDQKSENFVFKFMRKFGSLAIMLLCLISPFFLPGPIQTQVTVTKESIPLIKALQTFSVSGYSQSWDLALKADVSVQYYFLPVYLKENQAALSLFNIGTKKELQFIELKTYDTNDLLNILNYANPLVKVRAKNNSTKELVKTALSLSPLTFFSTLENQGPFFGGSLLVKNEILRLLNFQDDVVVKEIGSSLPHLILSDSNQELILLFPKDQIVAFKIIGPRPYDHGLSEAFHHSILTQFYLENGESYQESSVESDILRPLDELKHGNITALLTYYSNEAKKQSNSNVINQTFGVLYLQNKKAILKNVLSRLKTSRDETVAKSIAEINALLNDEDKTNDRKSSGKKDVRKNPRSSKRTLQIQTRTRR